jgi:hypothetical protein
MEFDLAALTRILVSVFIAALALAALMWRKPRDLAQRHPWLYAALIALLVGPFGVYYYRQRNYGMAALELFIILLVAFEAIWLRRTRR